MNRTRPRREGSEADRRVASGPVVVHEICESGGRVVTTAEEVVTDFVFA
jgi:hypothetical protein